MGSVICRYCRGEGEIVCISCNGKGFLDDDENETEEMAVENPARKRVCALCKGKGLLRCKNCAGRGIVDMPYFS